MNKSAVDFPLENLCFNRKKSVTQLAAASSCGSLGKMRERLFLNGHLEVKPWRQKEFSLLDPDNNLLTFGESLQ